MLWKRLPIVGKLFVAMAIATTLIVAFMAAMIANNMRSGFSLYLAEAELQRFEDLERALASTHDASKPGWPELRTTPEAWHDFIRANHQPVGRPPPAGASPKGWQEIVDAPPHFKGRPPPPGARRIAERLTLFDAVGGVSAGATDRGQAIAKRPIFALNASRDAAPIGWLGLATPGASVETADNFFLFGQYRSLLLASLLGLALSAGTSFFLARHILFPITALSEEVEALKAGDFTARIQLSRHDELGVLIDHHNALAATLEAADAAERQWITDTSHELQTPLANLRAEIEAIQDGIRQPTEPVVASLHASVMRLSRLVGDLNTLSRTREGALTISPQRTNITDIIKDAVAQAQPQAIAAGLSLQCTAESDLVLHCDGLRLRQLLDNLLENSRRYTSAPGTIGLAARRRDGTIVLMIEDSAPQPPEAALPHLFQRFFRVEPSRSRAHGGSGLGLAICRSIVSAHGGTITARHSALGGLCVEVILPIRDIQPEAPNGRA